MTLLRSVAKPSAGILPAPACPGNGILRGGPVCCWQPARGGFRMDWATLRDQFPVTRDWAFLDHAAVAPLPAPAVRALAAYAHSLAQNGVADVLHWVRRVDEVRRLTARLLNADPLDVAFVKNTSEGVGIVAEGFPWKPGDNVVTAEDEYPANLYPWMNLASRSVEVRRVKSQRGRIPLDDLRAAIDARTRILS